MNDYKKITNPLGYQTGIKEDLFLAVSVSCIVKRNNVKLAEA